MKSAAQNLSVVLMTAALWMSPHVGRRRTPTCGDEKTPPARDYQFDGTISRAVLENYLSRSISMEGLLNGRGDLDDNIRMFKTTGAKFIGRSLCLWGGEADLSATSNEQSSRSPRSAPPTRT